MEYDVMSNPLKKVQEISGSEVASSHDLTYLYGGEKPNAATQIGEDKYTYDMNGNPTLIENDSTSRQMRWDEENRLTMVNDDGYVSRYTYDHAGVRTVKSHGPLEGVAINGAAQGLDYHDKENYTIYVSPYMTVTADRFTKHYYAGTQRIASKIGGGGDFDNVYGVESFHLTAGQKDYADRLVMMESGVQEYYKKSGIPPGPPTNKGQNADPYATDVALPNVPLGDYSVPSGWPTDPKFNAKGDVPGPPAMWQPEEDLTDPPAGYGFTPDSTPEKDIYFFHSDHLGSTSYLTDTAGNVTQFVWYSPYGESIIDEHTTSYENPFKFSGKELDDVTGLYDHGARSRNPVTTLWLGVDPLWEKYPDFSPYSYCMANPVRLVDPDGQAVYGRQNEDGTMSYIVGENGDITAEGYTWIDDSYDCMDENGNYKQLPGGQSTQSSQTAQATQSAPQTVENTGSPDKSMWKSFYDAFLAPGALEGHSDPANQGIITSQDVTVGLGVAGVLAGGISLGAELVAGSLTITNGVITGLGIVNSADDVLTDKNGESFSVRSVDSKFGKTGLGVLKAGIGIVNIRNDINTIREVHAAQMSTNVVNATNAVPTLTQKATNAIDATVTGSGLFKTGYDVVKPQR